MGTGILLKRTENFFVATEDLANEMIKEAQAEGNLIKYSTTFKEKKEKGEVVATYYVVSLTKEFDKEKDLI